VWPAEPPTPDDPRLQTRGLLVTPHVGWSSAQADDAYRVEAIAVLRATLTRPVDALTGESRTTL
jgi:phosphoglycerate dehydrogenase-like enzyme